jgi:hypothetical protein
MQLYITYDRPTRSGERNTSSVYINLDWSMNPSVDDLSIEAAQAIADIFLTQPRILGVTVQPNN